VTENLSAQGSNFDMIVKMSLSVSFALHPRKYLCNTFQFVIVSM